MSSGRTVKELQEAGLWVEFVTVPDHHLSFRAVFGHDVQRSASLFLITVES